LILFRIIVLTFKCYYWCADIKIELLFYIERTLVARLELLFGV